jgi:hypothetical protein
LAALYCAELLWVFLLVLFASLIRTCVPRGSHEGASPGHCIDWRTYAGQEFLRCVLSSFHSILACASKGVLAYACSCPVVRNLVFFQLLTFWLEKRRGKKKEDDC